MDDELRSFVAARWAPLVRTFVALGPGVGQAGVLAGQALARLASEPRSDGDADVRLAEAVVETWRDERRRWWARAPEPRPVSPAWARVEPELDRLAGADRMAVALTAGLRLPEALLLEVLDAAPPPAGLVDRGAVALGSLPLPAAPDRLREAGRRRGRGAVRATAAAVLVVVVVAAAWNLAIDRGSDGSGAASARVAREENPLPATWYADGRLHLADVVVRVPGLTSFAAWTDGAVAAGADGRLLAIDAEGTTRPIGITAPGAAYALEPRLGLLAFIDTAPATAVNVVDVSTGETRLRQATAGPESRVVAMVGTVVVQSDRRGYTRTQIGTALSKTNTVLVRRRHLLDLAGTTRLFLRGSVLSADRTDDDSPPTRLEGVEEAGLSDDGRYAWVRRTGLDDVGVLDLVQVEGLPLDLPDHQVTTSVALVRGELAPQAVLVLALGQGRYRLVGCALADGSCGDPVDVDSATVPLLGT